MEYTVQRNTGYNYRRYSNNRTNVKSYARIAVYRNKQTSNVYGKGGKQMKMKLVPDVRIWADYPNSDIINERRKIAVYEKDYKTLAMLDALIVCKNLKEL